MKITGKEETDRPQERLSRRDRGRRQPDRPAPSARRFRSADLGRAAHGLSALLPVRRGRRERGSLRHALRREPGKNDPGRRAGNHRRLLRRRTQREGHRRPAQRRRRAAVQRDAVTPLRGHPDPGQLPEQRQDAGHAAQRRGHQDPGDPGPPLPGTGPGNDRFSPSSVPARGWLRDHPRPGAHPGAGGKRRHARPHPDPVGQGRPGIPGPDEGGRAGPGHAHRDPQNPGPGAGLPGPPAGHAGHPRRR